jgi:hypothetical protein
MEIIGDTTLINGTDVFIQKMSMEVMGMADTVIYYIAASDTAIHRFDSVFDTIPYVLLELPLAEGNSWVVSWSQTAIVLDRCFVSVPAGNYGSCWEIAYTDGNDTVYDYYAANTGLIKEYFLDSGGGASIRAEIELRSASIQ